MIHDSLPYMRYLAALIRIRELIASGLSLQYYDDETIGNKSTECTWGLCQEDKSHWPDPQDYLWPDMPDRVAPKHLKKDCLCPLDKRRDASNGNGCFYTCRIFQSKKKNLPTREEVLALYDAKITETKAKIGVP